MGTTSKTWGRYLVLGFVAVVAALGIAQLRKPRKPRSFREDPIGALKDRGEILASRTHDATEETLARLQESLDELRGRLPEMNQRNVNKGRKQFNKRLDNVSNQVQSLVKDARSNNVFNR